MKYVLALVVTALALFAGPLTVKTASAHSICTQNTLKCAQKNERHARTAIRWVRHHAARYHKYRLYRHELRVHRTLLRVSAREVARLLSAAQPPHYRDWMCIHSHEGAWDDPDAPYYGGLQANMDFVLTYGRALYERKGTPDHWTPLEQMWMAERAWRTRGFYPWPETARMCGLI